VPAAAPAFYSSVPRAQKAHRPWSIEEVSALIDGVAHFGRGQWADIKALQAAGVAAALAQRSSVDLKDKWRNLTRVAAIAEKEASEKAIDPSRPPRRRELTEVPVEMLERVRALCAAAPPPPPAAAEAGAGADDTAEGAAVAAAAAGRRSKRHTPWTLSESWALVEGVQAAGGCRWTQLKASSGRDAYALVARTAMDLKDKWRNLLALAQLPVEARRKTEAPTSLLERVLALEQRYGAARRRGRRSPGSEDS
jgi:hypothetical protein